jgi:O-antigen ligase
MTAVVHPVRWSRRSTASEGATVHGLAVGVTAAAIALLPVLEPKGPGNSGPMDAFLGVALVAALVWAATSGERLHLPYVIPFAILAVAGTVSAILGAFPSEGLLALVQEVILLAWCAAIANLARSPAALDRFLGAWSWSAIAWAMLMVVAVAAGWEIAGAESSEGTRAALTLGNSNLAASYFVISLMVVLASGRPRNLVARTVGAALLILAVIYTGSLAGMVGLTVGLLVAAVVATSRRAGPLAATLLLIGALVAGGVGLIAFARYRVAETARASGNVLLRDSLGRGAESASERTILLREQLELYVSGDLVGRGPASTKSTLESNQAPYAREAHNDYVAALIERGLLGAVGIVVLIGAVAMRATAIGRPLAPRFRRSVATTAPLVGAVAAAGVMGFTHEVLHQRHLWALLGVLAAIHLWARHSPATEVRS